ncbi:MAG TPA: polyphosphate kinase 2 family protein [Flavobacteriales bacterium]|nr:polyphosphate kinase 2 family protein [Flavobacteriales bacterium]
MKDLLDLSRYRVHQSGKVDLDKYPTDLGDEREKKALKAALEKDTHRISELQETLYAQGSHALLLIFQAMDGAGKDSCIDHVMTGVNPQGCHVTSFKTPSSEELAHDFLWRHAKAVPARGMIGIHNRSHYEEVLAVKVHPEFLAGQHLPSVADPTKVDKDFWEDRYASIRDFETHLARQGVTILKFFLHLGKDAQKERFLERIDDPKKNWKFNAGDVKERIHWEAYQQAYADAIGATAADHAPWFIIPADDQWESRAIVGRAVREQLEAMDLRMPVLDSKAKAGLAEARKLLEKERG